MIRIGLISDTHIPEAGDRLPPEVYEVFQGVDLILHAGDIHDLIVLDWLETLAPVKGARGNGENGNAGRDVQPDDPRIPMANLIEIGGIRIGVTHHLPLPEQLPYRTMEIMTQREFGGPVDVVVCGDTHVEMVEIIKNTIVVNPGSPTLPHNLLMQPGTVGMLEITDEAITAKIIPLWDLSWQDYDGTPPVPPLPDKRMWRNFGPWFGRLVRPGVSLAAEEGL